MRVWTPIQIIDAERQEACKLVGSSIMKKFLLPLAALCLIFTSCKKVTPENYFDRTVLNSNLLHGFAGDAGIEQEMKLPSIKLVNPSDPQSETAQMTRKEVVEKHLASIEHSYGKVKELPETEDTREMLRASVALYEYVLPVYRNEYQQLARLYDEGAPETEIENSRRTIQEQYRTGFETRMAALRAAGKPYAELHGIRVNF